MSKRLPYYQFEPAEYLAGDIMFCSYGAQGVFTILCALYWQKDCLLTLEPAKRRINNSDAYFNELIKENIIKLNGNDISISFLDAQFKDATKKSNINSSNGKKGAEVRQRKNSESIATPFLNDGETDGESIALREDKIKEDKIKEDNIIDNGIFSQKSKTDTQWIETIAMQNHINTNVIMSYIDNFESHLIVMQEQKENESDFKRHFTHWLNKQDLSQFRNKVIGKTNQI